MADHGHPSIDGDDGPDSPRKKARLEQSSPNATMHDTIEKVFPTNPSFQRSADAMRSIPDTALPTESPGSNIMPAVPPAQNEAVYDQVSKETACGITEFVCPDLLGFTGTLKKRYTDFLVNEILPSGQVVHLDDTRAPRRGKKKGATETRSSGQSNPSTDALHTEVQQAEGHGSAPSPTKPEPSVTPSAPKSVTAEPSAGDETALTPQNENVGTNDLSKSGELNGLASKSSDISAPTTETERVNDITMHDDDPQSNPPIPMSMHDYDQPAKKPVELAPHMRIQASSLPVPLSMRDPNDTQAALKPTRKKETVRMHRTSQGWIEVDEQMEKELKDAEAAKAAAATQQLGGVPTQVEDKPDGETEEQNPEKPIVQTTQASWQAFATDTSTDAEATIGFQLKSQDLTTLLSYFSPDIVLEIVSLFDRILRSPHRKAKDHGSVTSAVIDRHTRSKIHQDIRQIFESRLETATNNDGAMVITAMPEKSTFYGRTPMDGIHGDGHRGDRNHGRNDRSRGGNRNNRLEGGGWVNKRDQWAELGGDYLHFSLYKENKDTMESIFYLSKILNMKPSAFQFAGTKDRRGVTVQRVSVYRVFAERMVDAGRALRNAKIGNFEYMPHPLQLGELTGNEFVITLRDCDFHYPIPVDSETLVDTARAVVRDAITNLATNGFINYYGLQRFGTFATSTDEVGVKMLQGDFEAAVDSILQFNPASLEVAQDPMASTGDKVSQDDRSRAIAINTFKTTGKAYPAMNDLPRKFSAESCIIKHLGQKNNAHDFLGAIQAVTRNMRLLYVHAYQSLVWNMVASERWRRFGPTVVEGDLVVIDEHKDKTEPQSKHANIDNDGEAIVRPSEDDRATDPEDMFTRARALSKEEAESGMYSIFDIVLPSPGYDIIYPANEMGKYYETFMASERGGGLDPHNMRRKWKDISLSGSYRKLLARPGEDFSFDIKVYQNEDEQFVETDADRLEKAKKKRVDAQHSRSAPLCDDPAKTAVDCNETYTVAEGSKSEPKHENSSSVDSEPGGVSLNGGPYHGYKIAVILKLQLGSSQYATMALRELMKHGGARAYKPDFGGGR